MDPSGGGGPPTHNRSSNTSNGSPTSAPLPAASIEVIAVAGSPRSNEAAAPDNDRISHRASGSSQTLQRQQQMFLRQQATSPHPPSGATSNSASAASSPPGGSHGNYGHLAAPSVRPSAASPSAAAASASLYSQYHQPPAGSSSRRLSAAPGPPPAVAPAPPPHPPAGTHRHGSVTTNQDPASLSLSERLSLHQHQLGHHPPAAALRHARRFSGTSSDDNMAPERECERSMFEGYGAEGATDPNIDTTACGTWTRVEPAAGSVIPSPRSLHAGAVWADKWYLFGGYSGHERVNTFLCFDFGTQIWSIIESNDPSSTPPSPRDRHVALAYDGSIYIHGGFDGSQRKADFYAYSIANQTWRPVTGAGRAPTARHSHTVVVYRHCAYIFGGYDGSYKSDLIEYDFGQRRWTSVQPTAGLRPRARYRAAAVVHQDSMIVYGGHDGTRHLCDVHIFDFVTRTWHALTTTGMAGGPTPVPRDSHVAVLYQTTESAAPSMFCFGGSSGTALNDLNELVLLPAAGSANISRSTSPTNISDDGTDDSTSQLMVGQWRSVRTTASGTTTTHSPSSQSSKKDPPQQRFCHTGAIYKDSLWIFGGYNGSDRLNDVYKFDFAVCDLSFEVPPSTLIPDLRSMINNSTMSDVTFEVQGQPVYAHKLLLMRSSYFQALFLGDMKESRASTIVIEQVSYDVFLSLLEYLYTDTLSISFNNAMELFEAADLFCIPRLKTMCEKRMLQSITVDNAAGIFFAADMYSATALRAKAKTYILSHFEDVSKSHSFEEMGRSNIELVFELLKSR